MSETNHVLKQGDVDRYNMLYPILGTILEEMKELSKKKQDGPLNEMKVKIANRVLSKVKVLLEDYPTIEFLDLLDEVNLPTNSDAVLIIAQFKAAMEQYRKRNSFYKGVSLIWNIYKDSKS